MLPRFTALPAPLPHLLTAVRLLDVVKILVPLLPEIELPDKLISVEEKLVYTVSSGSVFVMSHLPIYGLVKDAPLKMVDPLFAWRPLFAMEQGTLMELGLLPMFTAAFLWQVAAALKLVKANFMFSHDRELFQSAQKVTSFVLAAVFGASLIALGYFDAVIRGSSGASAWGWYMLIFLQIFGWNVMLTFMVEILDKGYGFGSGLLSYVAFNAATRLVRDVAGVELVSATPGGTPETYGVVTFLVKALLSMDFAEIKKAVTGIFFRSGFPTIGMVLIVLASGLVTIMLQNFRLELPVRSNKARGTANVYPIKMMYTGALPVLFAFTVMANMQIALHFASIALAPMNPVLAALVETRGESGAAIGGVSFYLSPPSSWTASLLSPARAVTYVASIVLLSVWFASLWCEVSGSAPKDIAKQFKDQEIIISGKRDTSASRDLAKVIPRSSVTGAALLTAVALVGEFVGASGKSVSVVVGVSSAFAIMEEFMVDLQQNGGSSQLMNSLGVNK